MSSYSFISYATLTNNPMPPPEFANIDSGTWQMLRSSVSNATNTANTNACIGEVLCCLCFSFPCIFLFHPCIYKALKDGTLRSDINQLNYSRYGGNVVFSVHTDGIQVLMSALPTQTIIIPRQAEVTTVHVHTTATTGNQPYEVHAVPMGNDNHIPIVSAEEVKPTMVQASTTRSMVVTLPGNVYPYAVIRVPTPEGNEISVSAPRDAHAGQQITVNY